MIQQVWLLSSVLNVGSWGNKGVLQKSFGGHCLTNDHLENCD